MHKTIYVVAAIIEREGRVLATQRGYGDYKDWWEFPGGKIEPGEAPEDALKREIREELEVEIKINEFFQRVEYDYPKFHIVMDSYICHITEGEPVLIEHEAAKWLTPEELGSVKWLPSDIEIINNYIAKSILNNLSDNN